MTKTTTPKPSAFALALMVTLASAGCVGTGPNTQRGAVGGAALGGLAGAIIGNNTGHGNALGGAAIGAAAGALAGGTLGNAADNERGTLYHSEDEASTNVAVEDPPPPPPPQREYVGPQPTPSAVWIPGFWAYSDGGRYVWVAGHWEIPPPRYHTYYPPHWRRRGHLYIYVHGYWR